MTNEELIHRTLIDTGAMTSAGKLLPMQAKKFVDYVRDQSVMRDIARIVSFRNEEAYIEKIAVNQRVAMAKEEGVDPGRRRKVTHSRVILNPRRIVVPWDITDEYIQQNLEGPDVEDKIIQLMARQLANDIDELALDGNLLGPARIENDLFPGGSTSEYIKDAYIGLQDGWLKLAESGHVVDYANGAIDADAFNKAILSMPTKFRRRRDMIKYFISWDHEQAYRKDFGDRETPGGDRALESQLNLRPFGIEMIPVPLLEKEPIYVENSVANTDGTTATQLAYKPITELVLTPTTLGDTPQAKYQLGSDYSQDLTNGTWTRLGGGTIPSGGTIKATYRTAGKMLLTMPENLIIGVGLQIKILRDVNINKDTHEYAIHASVAIQFEETDAVVMVTNIKDPLL